MRPGFMNGQNLCIEIAILEKDIKASDPKSAPFSIPALGTGHYRGMKYVNNYNVINKNKTSTPSVSTLTIDNQIVLEVPREYTRYYGSLIIPKGTKFIVGFISGDINSIKIIGRYDGKNGDVYDEFTLPIATREILGGVIIGDGLIIDEKGVLRNASKPIPDETINEIIDEIMKHVGDSSGGTGEGGTTIIQKCDCKPIPDNTIDDLVKLILDSKPSGGGSSSSGCECKSIPDTTIDDLVKLILDSKPSGGGSSGGDTGGGTTGLVKYTAIDKSVQVKNYKVLNN